MTLAGTLAIFVLAQSTGGAAPVSAGQVGPPAPAGLSPILTAAEPTPVGLYIAIGSVCLGVVLFITAAVAMWRRRRTDPGIETTAPFKDAAAPERKPENVPVRSNDVREAQRLFNLMGDAEELVGRLSLQLNENAARLEQLILAADERIARLEHLAALPPPVSPPPAIPAAPSSPSTPPRTLLPLVSVAHAPNTAPPPIPVAAPIIVTRPVRVPAPVSVDISQARTADAVAPAPSQTPEPEYLDPLTVQIYRLADDGLAVVEIAKQLGQHTGKIELILALRQA